MNRKVSVAPMMDCTDRHERYFLRLISKNTLLYTEMVVMKQSTEEIKKDYLNLISTKNLLPFN
jgi:tRNA-dihydrouridine synthase A